MQKFDCQNCKNNGMTIWFSKKGQESTPDHSEYDLGKQCDIFAVHNGCCIDRQFIIVEDETKPVLFVMYNAQDLLHNIFVFKTHCDQITTRYEQVSLLPVTSGDGGAQLFQYATKENNSIFVKMRRGITAYYAFSGTEIPAVISDTSSGGHITFLSMLAYLGKELAWFEIPSYVQDGMK